MYAYVYERFIRDWVIPLPGESPMSKQPEKKEEKKAPPKEEKKEEKKAPKK